MTKNYLDLNVDDQPVRALVDSGASFSVVSNKFRRQLRKVMFPTDENVLLKVADGGHVRPMGKCVLRLDINGMIRPFEFTVMPKCSHDVILGWDFLKTSGAVVDCGRSELMFDDIVQDSQPIETWRVNTIQDCILPPHSIAKVIVTNPQINSNTDVIVEGSRLLLLDKDVAVPSTILTFQNNKAELWVANAQSEAKFIPKGMCVGYAEVLDKKYLNCISNTQICATSKLKVDAPPVDYSQMMALDLTVDRRQQLLKLLSEFPAIFDQSRKAGSRVNVKHRVITGDHLPISQRAYRVSPAERRIIQKEVEKMLDRDVIQPSESPWSSPVVLVKKKDGSWRFCVDYRRLNKITKKDAYPLPRIDDTLDSLKGAKFFSSIDLYSGYWQIEVDEADREKTAFITPEGLYEFKVMPFGLCNAPATFERMMDNLLRHLKWTMCLCYLDDIVVFSETFDGHLQRLNVVLNCIQDAGLILNPKKCLFGAQQIKILGHLVSEGCVRPDPDKVKAVKCFPTPKNVHDVRSFLGLCSYYRRFIKDFCHKAQPLQILLKGDSKFHWGREQADAFHRLKEILISDPILGLYDENAETELHVDASGYGIGAVLVQIQNGKETVIAYASRTLTKAEKNYSTTERECLAAIWAVHKFRPYLFGKHFSIVTDHHSLCWLTNLKDPSGRLARWALRLQEYDISINYKSGKKHKDADSLSRNPVEEDRMLSDVIAAICVDNIAEEQMKDPGLVELIRAVEDAKPVKGEFQLIGDILCKKNFDPTGKQWLPVIPKHLRRDILQHFHDAPMAGHLGFVKTYDRLRKRFHWPGLYRNVRRYVMHCRECQRRKAVPQKPPGHLMPIPPAVEPFHRIGIDLLGRFPNSNAGNKWIIVCTDYLSRYAVTKALKTAEAPEVAKFLVEEVLLKHGAPRVIITDRGKVFQSNLVSEIIRLCSIKHRMTTAYHPQTNGLTERFNKTLGDMLSMYVDVDQRDWDEILPFVTFAYNTAKQDVTGFTPFYLLHGREAETTLDTLFPFCPEVENDYTKHLVVKTEEARQLARLRTLEAQEKDRRRYNSKHRVVSYSPGDLVWVFTPVRKVGLSEKLLKKYFGPYKVLRRLSDVTYEVQDYEPASRRRKQIDIVHVLRMKPYFDPEQQTQDLDGDATTAEDERLEEDAYSHGKIHYTGPQTRSRSKAMAP